MKTHFSGNIPLQISSIESGLSIRVADRATMKHLSEVLVHIPKSDIWLMTNARGWVTLPALAYHDKLRFHLQGYGEVTLSFGHIKASKLVLLRPSLLNPTNMLEDIFLTLHTEDQ